MLQKCYPLEIFFNLALIDRNVNIYQAATSHNFYKIFSNSCNNVFDELIEIFEIETMENNITGTLFLEKSGVHKKWVKILTKSKGAN